MILILAKPPSHACMYIRALILVSIYTYILYITILPFLRLEVGGCSKTDLS